MNRVIPLPPTDWRAHLASLPEVDPPETLWLRLQAAQRQGRSARAPWRWLAAAAAFALAVVIAWPGTQTQPAAPSVTALPVPAAVRSDDSLRRLDDEIARAYARNAGEAELAALWQTRERLIESQQGPAPALLARL